MVYGLVLAPVISDQVVPLEEDCHTIVPFSPESERVVVELEQIPVLLAEAVPPTDWASTVTANELVKAAGQVPLVTLARK